MAPSLGTTALDSKMKIALLTARVEATAIFPHCPAAMLDLDVFSSGWCVHMGHRIHGHREVVALDDAACHQGDHGVPHSPRLCIGPRARPVFPAPRLEQATIRNLSY